MAEISEDGNGFPIEIGARARENVSGNEVENALAVIDQFLTVDLSKRVTSLETLSDVCSAIGPALLVVFQSRAKPEREEGISMMSAVRGGLTRQDPNAADIVENVVWVRDGRSTVQLSASERYPAVELEVYRIKRGWHTTVCQVLVPTARPMSEYRPAEETREGTLRAGLASVSEFSATDYGGRLPKVSIIPTGMQQQLPPSTFLNPAVRPKDSLQYAVLLQRSVHALRSGLTDPPPIPESFAKGF
jgi:hypothetical protein